jgi:(R,R)-butanediol dehydrogenase / meso-butanediol dehydrogenase / diacetyl reductase
MRAVVWHGARDVRVEDVDRPAPPATGQVLVEVARCGLCGSDRRAYERGPAAPSSAPHPLTGHVGPVILGHEVVGRIVARGPDVPDALELGRRVAVDPTWSCGRCPACRRGQQQLCDIAACSGLSANGGLASHMIASAAGLAVVPDHVSDDEAAMAEPLAVAVHALSRAALQPGDRVIVAGFGPIGAAVALTARALGAGDVAIVEPSPYRRRLASGLGFADVIDPGSPDAPGEGGVQARRGWADVAFDCSAAPGVLARCIRATRPGARIVVPAVSSGLTPIPMSQVVLGERSLVGSLGYNGDVARAVSLIATRAVDVRPLISAVLPLPAVPGWLADGDAAGLKVLIDPTA